jgi:hypothetical protein
MFYGDSTFFSESQHQWQVKDIKGTASFYSMHALQNKY